ncbi:MAG TPA: TonB-dependent receptor [bacterium]
MVERVRRAGRALCVGLLGVLLPALASAQSGGASSNPSIGLVLNGYYANYSKDVPFTVPGFVLGGEAAPGAPGLNLGESEIGIYGNIDPYFVGSAVISFSAEGGAEVEEAFIQTTALPAGFTVKAGRFFSGIGYLNSQHRHADDFFDAPLPYQVFLGGQFGDDGAQLRWVAPLNWLLEVGLESFRGDGFPAGGSAKQGNGAGAGYLKAGGDLGESQSWLVNLGQLQAKAKDRTTGDDEAAPESSFTGDSTVNLASLVWKWAPNGNGKTTNVKAQAEFFQRTENGVYTLDPTGGTPVVVNAKNGSKATQSGWYAQARYQFEERWRVGIRQAAVTADTLKDPAAKGTVLDGNGKSPTIGSAMVEYDPTEFSQIRLQYSNDQTDPKQTVARWYLQYIVTLGAHAAHSY